MNKRIEQFDFIRFISTLLIVISHFEFLEESKCGNIYLKYIHNPTFGVDFFFIISGFGLYLSCIHKDISVSLKNNIIFAIKRIKKNYFVYFFSLVLSLLINIIWISHGVKKTQIVSFLIDLTLLQSMFGSSLLSHSINPVCWFISCLFICYFFVPFILKQVKLHINTILKTISFLLLTICLIFFLSFLFVKIELVFTDVLIYHGISLIDDLFYGSPYIRLFYVILGILLANLYLQLKDFVDDVTPFEIIFSICSIIYFFIRNSINLPTYVVRLFDILNVIIIIFIFSFGKGKLSILLSKNKKICDIGRIYGIYIYLFHYPAKMFIANIINRDLFLKYKFGMISEIILIIVFTILFTLLCKLIQYIVTKIKNKEN